MKIGRDIGNPIDFKEAVEFISVKYIYIMTVLGLIPARGGSKGIFRKNIKNLCGKPLIAWTIEAALKSSKIDRLVVTTEDNEIADIARQYGAKVPFYVLLS